MLIRLQSKLANGGWKWGIFSILVLLILILPVPAFSAAPADRQIKINASSFEYDPAVIRVNPGDRVTLELSSTDVTHGIAIDGYNLQVTAEPGQKQSLTFIADRQGTYRLRCSVTCGALHPFMIGKLHVGPNVLLLKSIAIATLGLAAVFWSGTRQ